MMVSGARWLRAVEVTVQLLIFWDLSRELHFDAVDEIFPHRAAAVLLRPAWVERFHLILFFFMQTYAPGAFLRQNAVARPRLVV